MENPKFTARAVNFEPGGWWLKTPLWTTGWYFSRKTPRSSAAPSPLLSGTSGSWEVPAGNLCRCRSRRQDVGRGRRQECCLNDQGWRHLARGGEEPLLCVRGCALRASRDARQGLGCPGASNFERTFPLLAAYRRHTARRCQPYMARQPARLYLWIFPFTLWLQGRICAWQVSSVGFIVLGGVKGGVRLAADTGEHNRPAPHSGSAIRQRRPARLDRRVR